ncbi:MAG: SDR family NAD(P)-dependent oxidoreductase, partial [Pirellulales bacterium]|nr:SDR family NAD(P)-dependent oxidoreductase [Pirellulales bacterium]
MSYYKMRDLSEQCGILTGATSGVGRAVAKLLAERGARLVISGRRESRLVELASEYPGLLIPLPGDITKSEFQEELVEKARVAFGGIDLVIAAAGAGAVGPFSESSLNVVRSVFEIDFFAPIELVFKSLPQLKNGREPVVVLIGSILGIHPLPLHLSLIHISEPTRLSRISYSVFSLKKNTKQRRLPDYNTSYTTYTT